MLLLLVQRSAQGVLSDRIREQRSNDSSTVVEMSPLFSFDRRNDCLLVAICLRCYYTDKRYCP